VFEAQVERSPDATAVIFEDQQLSYRELNSRANQLAHRLQGLGVGPETVVGICMERSIEMVVGQLGTLKAGGAYLALDPEYPKERLAFMLEETEATVLLTQQRLIEKLPEHRVRLICLDREWGEIAGQSQENPISETTSENLSYVIYTSGSTGKPKGVGVTHRGVLRLLIGVDYVRLDANQTFLHLASTSFDASTFEIWGGLLHGGKCVVFPGKTPLPNELGHIVDHYKVSTLWLTGSLFNTVIDEAPEALRGVSQLLIGGEALSVSHVRRALAHLPGTRVINGYGPTESTTFTCCYPIPARLEDRSSIAIGGPIANTEVYLLDAYLSPVPIGVAGELYIGGDGLARGYLKEAALTAERFIPDGFSDKPGARLYRSGDLARYLADGNIEFLGRIDDQVKIRGFRIEPGEIESVLGRHPSVRQVAVLAREDTPADKRLVAYVVAEEALAVEELRSLVIAVLPDYMVPAAFVRLKSLPLTTNGKIDRAALPAPDESRPKLGQPYVGPRTPVETTLCEIFGALLRVGKVGIHDNFFELGGHSLLATQAVSRMREALGINIALRRLFEAPTVGDLAHLIENSNESHEADKAPAIVRVSRDSYRVKLQK
jgi:aspartate racemase